VKKKRRVELHIEHREISIFARPGQSQRQVIEMPWPEGAGLSQIRRMACPNCGSDLILLTDAVTHAHLDLALLTLGMQEGRIHFHRSNSGDWWICTKSFQQG
jgi:hypothetical protein